MRRQPDRRDWYVCGAGRVGSTLARIIEREGRLAGLWTRSEERAEEVGDALGVEVTHGAAPTFPERPANILLALPDDRLTSFARGLVGDARQHVLLHTSGASGGELLRGVLDADALGAVHPLHSFQGDARDVDALRGAFFALDGDGRACAAGEELAQWAGAHSAVVPASCRAAYHLAAVLSSNGTYAVLHAADQLAERAGISTPALRAGLARLAEGSASAARERGAVAAATGPIMRGDGGTVRHHLRVLEETAPELAPLYRELSEVLLRIAEVRGQRQAHQQAVMHALHGDAAGGSRD